MDSEQLLSLRNAFYSGNHSNVISEANDLFGAEGKVGVMRDVYLYRSYIEKKQYEKVFNAIQSSSPMGLQGVKLHATYKQSSDDNKEMVLEQLREWLSDASMSEDKIFCWVASQILYEAEDYKEALRLVHGGETLEMIAMRVQIFLKINRLDMAQKEVVTMQGIDDDDILTALCVVWTSLAKGTDEALHIAMEHINELIEKFEQTALLCNLLGICHIKLKNFSDAFNTLRRARELAKESGEAVSEDTLINSIVCVQHLGKPQLVDKVLSEFKATNPNHPYFKSLQLIEEQFDRAASERN